MTNSELKIDSRRQKILELLQLNGHVRVAELSKMFGATSVTIRSDLDALERNGYLERTQGGAVQTVRNFYNFDFTRRRQQNLDCKRAIAQAAVEYVSNGNTLLINSGTTTHLAAIELKRYKNISIVTNSLSIASELGAYPTFRVILLGGDINAQYLYTYGETAKEQLNRYKADYAILSIDGVSPEAGLTTYHAQEMMLNRTMIERAHKTIVVADHSKIGHEGFSYIADAASMDTLVTDERADQDTLRRISEKGIHVRIG